MSIRSDQPRSEVPQPKGSDYWSAPSLHEGSLAANYSSFDREEKFDSERQEFFSAMERYAIRPVSMLPAFRIIRNLTAQEPLQLQLDAGRELLRQWKKREGWCRELLNAARHSVDQYVCIASEIIQEWISSPALTKRRLPLLMLNRIHSDVGVQYGFGQDEALVRILLDALQCGQLLCELSKQEHDLSGRDRDHLALALMVSDWSLLAVHCLHQKIEPSQWPVYLTRHGQISAAMLMSVESITPRIRAWVSQHDVSDPRSTVDSVSRTRNRVTSLKGEASTFSRLTIPPGIERAKAILTICQQVNAISEFGKEDNPWNVGVRYAWREALRGKLPKDLIRSMAQFLTPEALGELRTVSFEGRRYRVDQGQSAAALLNGPHWLNRKQLKRRHAGLNALRKWKQQGAHSLESDAS